MAKRTLTIDIVGNNASAKRMFNDTEDAADRAGTSIVARLRGRLSGLSSIGSDILGGFIGGGVVAGFTALQPAIAGVVSEYQESVKVGNQTNAVIKSTAGVANVTARHLENLSGKLSEKIAVDDEAIQSAGNLLLTFTNVRNELGKGNNIYDQAVGLTQDLAAAMKTDGKSAAVLLGKALNDPAKGITALTRAGVTFTQQQKDQIQWALFFGDKLSAQKIVLGEVRKEFGGSAAAQATWLDKLKVKFANFQEGLGKWTAETAVPWLREMWPKVEDAWNKGVARARQIIEPFVNIIETLWARFGDNIVNFAKGAWAAIQNVIQGALTVIKGIFDFFSAVLNGDWSAAWSALGDIVSGVWQEIVGTIQMAWNEIKLVFGLAWEALTAIFGGLWDALKGLAADAWNGLVGIVVGGVQNTIDSIASLPGEILGLVGAVGGAAVSVGSAIIHGIADGVSQAVSVVGDIGAAIVNAMIGFINSNVIDPINSALDISFDAGWPIGEISIDTPDIPHIPRFHTGGVVPGRPGDEMLAILQAGEQVIPASAMGAATSSSSSGAAIVVHVHGTVVTDRELDQVVASALARHERHNRTKARR